MAEVKCWGETEPLLLDHGLHMHRIAFNAGGVCSEHIHKYRHNLFYVLSGSLLIRTWGHEGERVTETVLRAGDHLSVPPNVRHQFEGVRSGTALEIYWPFTGVKVDAHDIVRFTTGFVR